LTITTWYSYVLFDTAIGRCGIAWGGQGIVAVRPEAHELKTRARILKRRPMLEKHAAARRAA
jgi:methylated-DNA-[protein]-cysteine S-methyltransferase